MPESNVAVAISKTHSDDVDLAAAISRTLAYSDIFDFPLTLSEIHRYLIERLAPVEAVAATLGDLQQISRQGEFYALRGREAIFVQRHQRAATASRLWPLALRFGRLIGTLPFVRMVAVTGALASDNVEPGADLDYLVVTQPGRLWLCRAMILGINRIAKLLGLRAELCPNFLLSTDHLRLEDRDLFTAQELTRMVPVTGMDCYRTMRSANLWTDQYLPQAIGAPREIAGSERDAGLLKKVAEFILWLPIVSWLEKWEMNRKIAKFERQGHINSETRFSADFCKGHFDGHKQATLQAYESRLEALGISAK